MTNTQDANAGLNPEGVKTLIADVRRLRDAFLASGDVTTFEFQQLSEARDELTNLVRLMYERAIYKDD